MARLRARRADEPHHQPRRSCSRRCSRGLTGAGKAKFEMLGFDACLMANTAMLGMLAPLANWITASAELEPGHGWDYSALSAARRWRRIGRRPRQGDRELVPGLRGEPEHEQHHLARGRQLRGRAGPDERGQRRRQRARRRRPRAVAPTVAGTRASVLSYGRNPDPKLDFNLVDVGALASSLEWSCTPARSDRRRTERSGCVQGRRSWPVRAARACRSTSRRTASTYRKSYDNLPSSRDGTSSSTPITRAAPPPVERAARSSMTPRGRPRRLLTTSSSSRARSSRPRSGGRGRHDHRCAHPVRPAGRHAVRPSWSANPQVRSPRGPMASRAASWDLSELVVSDGDVERCRSTAS